MQPALNATVFIVDDDASVREALAWLLRSRHLPSETFASGEEFDRFLQGGFVPRDPSCVLLDVRMPGMSGLALFEKLIERGLAAALPVIFLTGHADVPTAVEAVKRGAFDFCEKPFSDNALVDRIEQAIAQSARTLEARRQATRLQSRLAELTERERDVMRLVVEGLPNKLIADQLDISVRTVETHRSHIQQKLLLSTRPDLVRYALEHGLI